MNFDVREKWTGQGAGRQSSDGVTGTQNLTRVFTIVTDDPANTTAQDAQYAEGTNGVNVPVLREPHPLNFFLRCDSIDCRQVSNIMYEATCTYSVPTFSNDKNNNQDPTSNGQPAKVRIFPVSTSEQIDSDINGKAIATVNNELYEPQPIDWFDLGISIQQRLSVFDPVLISTYLADGGAVNKDKFLNFPIGTCHIADFTAEETADPTNPYWDVFLAIHVRRAGKRASSDAKAWYRRIRHEGFLVKDGTGNIAAALDQRGNQMSRPILLKSDGTKETDPASAYFQEFEIFNSIKFSPLGFLW